ALERIGPLAREAAPEVQRLLQNKDEPTESRVQAARTLAVIGDATLAATALFEIIENRQLNFGHRHTALQSFRTWKGDPKEGVRHLVRALKVPEPQMRVSTLKILAELGAPAREAVPTLQRMLTDR